MKYLHDQSLSGETTDILRFYARRRGDIEVNKSMNISMNFEMLVEQVFAFNDGRTVFTGKVLCGPVFINKCRCSLHYNNVVLTCFDIEGEMIALKQNKPGMRSISTTHNLSMFVFGTLSNLILKSPPAE